MRGVDPQPASRARSLLVGFGLLAAAGLVLYFTSDFVFQAFKGPRPITEQELLQVTNTDPRDNYVSYTPPRAAVDTNWRFGKKDNPGTKYILLSVGNRQMICEAYVRAEGPTYTGQLESIKGSSVAEDVLPRIGGSSPEGRERFSPIMLRSVPNIWVGTSFALVSVSGLGVSGLVVLLRSRRGAPPHLLAPASRNDTNSDG